MSPSWARSLPSLPRKHSPMCCLPQRPIRHSTGPFWISGRLCAGMTYPGVSPVPYLVYATTSGIRDRKGTNQMELQHEN